jgi:hypothetical protein
MIFCGARLDNVANLHCEPSRLDTSQRSASPTLRHAGATGADRKQTERPPIIHTSPYLPEPVYEALRKIAFEERPKIHDVALGGTIWHCGGVGIRRLGAVILEEERKRDSTSL